MNFNSIEKAGIITIALLIGGFFIYNSISGSEASTANDYHYNNDPTTLILVERRDRPINIPNLSSPAPTQQTTPENTGTFEIFQPTDTNDDYQTLQPTDIKDDETIIEFSDEFDANQLFEQVDESSDIYSLVSEILSSIGSIDDMSLFLDAIDVPTIIDTLVENTSEDEIVEKETNIEEREASETIEDGIEEQETSEVKSNWFTNIINSIKNFFSNLSNSRPGMSMIPTAYAQTEECITGFKHEQESSNTAGSGSGFNNYLSQLIRDSTQNSRSTSSIQITEDVLYIQSNTELTPKIITSTPYTAVMVTLLSSIVEYYPVMFYLASPDCLDPSGSNGDLNIETLEAAWPYFLEHYQATDWLKEYFRSRSTDLATLIEQSNMARGDDVLLKMEQFFSL